MEIRHRFTGVVLASGDNLRVAVSGCKADLRGADLSGADLSGAELSWSSHDLIAEILRRAATTVDQHKVAGYVLIRRDMCWSDFIAIGDPLTRWALDELRKYVVEGDTHPDVLVSNTKAVAT